MDQRARELSLARPDLGPEEEALVLEVLRSGRLSLGPVLERFEREFADWLGVEDAVAVSSGTAGLHLAVRSEGWRCGDEVVVSPFTFVASANALVFEGIRPIFADIDPVSLNLDPDAAAVAVTEETVGMLAIDIFGMPCRIEGFQRVAEEKGLGLVEDAAQALGAVDSEGRRVGSAGNTSVFAFYANKQLTTGEGGMVVPRGPEVAERLRSERNQGRSADMSELDHGGLGYNYRLSDVAAAIGVAQLGKLDRMLADRDRIASLYRKALEGVQDLELLPDEIGGARRSWFVYPVMLPEGVDRNSIIEALAARGIPSKAYLPCVHLMPQFRAMGYGAGDFPVAEEVSSRSLALPFHTGLEDGDVEFVSDSLREALGAQ